MKGRVRKERKNGRREGGRQGGRERVLRANWHICYKRLSASRSAKFPSSALNTNMYVANKYADSGKQGLVYLSCSSPLSLVYCFVLPFCFFPFLYLFHFLCFFLYCSFLFIVLSFSLCFLSSTFFLSVLFPFLFNSFSFPFLSSCVKAR
jgi:hypothetical protein